MAQEHDRYTPNPQYQRALARRTALLDDGQVEVMLRQLINRWPQPARDEPLTPRNELFTKYTLEGLLHGPAAALADFDHVLEYGFDPGPEPGPAAPTRRRRGDADARP